MVHDDVEGATLLVHVFDELYLAAAHHAFGAHAVAASYLLIPVDESVAEAECDADVIIPFQHLQLAAFGARVQIDGVILVTEVHRNDVWIAFQVGDAYKAGVALEEDGFDSLLVFYNKGSHDGFVKW